MRCVRLNNGIKAATTTRTATKTVEVWTPPDTWADTSIATTNTILDEIDRGLESGQRYSDASKATWLPSQSPRHDGRRDVEQFDPQRFLRGQAVGRRPPTMLSKRLRESRTGRFLKKPSTSRSASKSNSVCLSPIRRGTDDSSRNARWPEQRSSASD